MSRKYFGTDGVRGRYGGPVINEDFLALLGCAVVRWLRAGGTASGSEGAGPRVLIGRDTRASGAALEAAVARGLRAAGANPVSLGVLPTPAVALAVREQQANLGAVITASHNPPEDNGLKFFGPGGVKLTDEQEAAIEGHLGGAVPEEVESLSSDPGALTAYIARCRQLLPEAALAGWRVVLDTANGATCASSPPTLRALGAEVVALGANPDGGNINVGVGSEHPGPLAESVRRVGAKVGLAHDGDGDRCVLCDEQGEVLDGDEILTILAVHALAEGRLAERTLVITEQSNLGVDAAVAAAGGKVVRTPVGDRYVIARMRKEGATLGGESSGHIVCADVSPTGDGLVAALRVFAVMRATGQPLSELRRTLRRFPQRTAALSVSGKPPLESLCALGAERRRLEAELAGSGRVLVRYSGTEAKLRLLVEGPSERVVAEGIARLQAAAAQDRLLV
ncbi:MAG: phosphoglucosamine mutase [Verrucomicrobia bacterium]|nr:phosphoglucosamine mutase [Verrucomicrobiota bacterium]